MTLLDDQLPANAIEVRPLEQELVNPAVSGIGSNHGSFLKANLIDYHFALCVEALSAHQNTERTVERD